MANLDVNNINLSVLKQYQSNFENEKNSFSNLSYRNFSNSYLNRCTDTYVSKMARKINKLYKEIEEAYEDINDWWKSYNKDAENLEKCIMGTSSSGSFDADELRSYAQSAFYDLEDYTNDYAMQQLSVVFDNLKTDVSQVREEVITTATGTLNSATTYLASQREARTDISTASMDVSDNISTPKEEPKKEQKGWGKFWGDVGSYLDRCWNIHNQTEQLNTQMQAQTNAMVAEAVTTVGDVIYDGALYVGASMTEQQLMQTYETSMVMGLFDENYKMDLNTLNSQIDAVWDGADAMAGKDLRLEAQKTSATVALATTSFGEGVAWFGEKLLDGMAIMGTMMNEQQLRETRQTSEIMGLFDEKYVISEDSMNSMIDATWEGTRELIEEEYVTDFFDNFYEENPIGSYIYNNAYYADTVRATSKEIGYFGASIGVSFTGMPMELVTGVAGLGRYTEDAWNDGASTKDGLAYGTCRALFDVVEVGIGKGISKLNIAKYLMPNGSAVGRQLLNTGTHMILDTADGTMSALVDPLFMMLYMPTEDKLAEILHPKSQYYGRNWEDLTFEEKYSALYEYSGGDQAVLTQALSAFVLSGAGEIGDVKKAAKIDNLVKNVDANAKTISNEYIDFINKMDGKDTAELLIQANKNGNITALSRYFSPEQFVSAISDLDATTIKGFLNNYDFSLFEDSLDENFIKKILKSFDLNDDIRDFKDLTEKVTDKLDYDVSKFANTDFNIERIESLSSINGKTGKELEELFFDDDYVIGIHRTGDYPADCILASGGLALTGHLSSGGVSSTIDLSNNISFFPKKSDNSYITFLQQLQAGCGYKTSNNKGDIIIIRIPKKDLASYADDVILTSSAFNSAIKTTSTVTSPILDSKYILGYVNSDHQNLSSLKINDKYGDIDYVNKHKDLIVDYSNNEDVIDMFEIELINNYLKNPIELGRRISGLSDERIARFIGNLEYQGRDVSCVTSLLSEEQLNNVNKLLNKDYSFDATLEASSMRAKVGKIADYSTDASKIKTELSKISPKLVEFYDYAKQQSERLKFFLGFEEHNFIHIKRVAEESVSTLTALNELIDSNKISGYGKINPDIVYKAGLAHDLGMKPGGYITFKDGTMASIDEIMADVTKYEAQLLELFDKKKLDDIFDIEGQLVRKFHPLNSAITVLQNPDMFGDDSELVACLALIHSKSTSGVRETNLYGELSLMVEKLYKGQTIGDAKIYDFDISKLVEVDENGNPITKVIFEETTLVIKDKETGITRYPKEVKEKTVYVFKEGVVEDFRSGALALRVGDAHAHKTGFNHNGQSININKNVSSEGTLSSYSRVKDDTAGLCAKEAEAADIDIGNSSLVSLSGDDYDYSKRIVLGEANSHTGDVYVENGVLTYDHHVNTTSAPACTWEFGIREKIGEYATFSNVKQRMYIHLPEAASIELKDFYENRARQFILDNQGFDKWLSIEVVMGGKK